MNSADDEADLVLSSHTASNARAWMISTPGLAKKAVKRFQEPCMDAGSGWRQVSRGPWALFCAQIGARHWALLPGSLIKYTAHTSSSVKCDETRARESTWKVLGYALHLGKQPYHIILRGYRDPVAVGRQVKPSQRFRALGSICAFSSPRMSGASFLLPLPQGHIALGYAPVF